MSGSSSDLFDDTAAIEATLERVMAVLGGRLLEDTTTAVESPSTLGHQTGHAEPATAPEGKERGRAQPKVGHAPPVTHG